MTRYLGFVRMAEGITEPPPQALFEAMDEFISRSAAAGIFIDGGGLYGTEDAVNFVVRADGVTRVDGPYAETKEVVGGWSLLQADSKEEIVANMQEMADLHAKHWPGMELVLTLRQVSEEPPSPE